MGPVQITCSAFFLLLLFSEACSPAIEAGKPSPKGPSMIAPIRTGTTYQNWLATPMIAEGNSMSSVMWKWIKGGERERPEGAIPVVQLDKGSFAEAPAAGLLFRWLGHSTVLIEMGGSRVLIDPVFERHASPVPGITKRFSRAPVRLEDLPAIDAVVISHDHYDHLEKD